MAVIQAIDPGSATGRTKELFDHLQHALHSVPAMVRVMAHSPAVLDTYLHFNHALEQGTLSPKTRALITVAIAELTGSDYTLSIGMAIARKQGIPLEDLEAARLGQARDGKTADTLRFASDIVRLAGRVPHAEVERLRSRGFSDAEIIDIIGAVGLNLFRNYFNLVVGTEIDVPLVATRQTVAHG